MAQWQQKLVSPIHSNSLLKTVARLPTVSKNKLSDIQVKAGGTVFHCHKLILAIQSPYFDGILFPIQAAAQSSLVEIKDINAEDFQNILDFMYKSEITLNDQNVENIFRGADALRIEQLKTICNDCMIQKLSKDNCVRYWRIAHQAGLQMLATSCKKLCWQDFTEPGPDTLLNDMPQEMLAAVLGDDNDLDVQHEVDLCQMLTKWLDIQAQKGRSVKPRELLTGIRWSSVPVEYVKTRLLSNDILKQDRPSFNFLCKVISYRLTGVPFEKLQTHHRRSTGMEQCIVIVVHGGAVKHTAPVYRISLKDPATRDKLKELHTVMQLDAPACVNNNVIYVTGIGSSSKEAWKYDPVIGWGRCGEMIEGRLKHCAVFAGNASMFVFGGWAESSKVTLESIEEYSTTKNKWTVVGQLAEPAQSAACVAHKTLIYVFGGTGWDSASKTEKELDCIQQYDTATRQCTILQQSLPQPLSLLRAVLWENSAILINYRTCLIFDLELNTIEQRDRFKVDVLNFGQVLEDENIYVIGGGKSSTDQSGKAIWTCTDLVQRVPVMDIINDNPTAKWMQHAKLLTPCCVNTYGVMTLPL